MSTARFANEPAVAGPERDTWLRRYGQSLRFALHVITHPFDGFWDLIHEKRGSMAAAHTFLFLFLLTRVLKLICTNFQFISAPIQHINLFEEAASLLLPFLVLCVANWAMTTLFEGKGRFRDIYIDAQSATRMLAEYVDNARLRQLGQLTQNLTGYQMESTRLRF